MIDFTLWVLAVWSAGVVVYSFFEGVSRPLDATPSRAMQIVEAACWPIMLAGFALALLVAIPSGIGIRVRNAWLVFVHGLNAAKPAQPPGNAPQTAHSAPNPSPPDPATASA